MKKIINKFKNIISENFKFWEVIILMGLTLTVGISLGSFIAKNSFGMINNKDMSPALSEFVNNYNNISKNYYGDINETEVLNKALQAVLNEIDDPYAVYFNETESTNFNIILSGSYYGLGVEIGVNKKTNELVITQVINDSPAFKSGLKVGDVMLKLNGEDISTMSSMDVHNLIKSLTDNFVLTIKRNNTEKDFVVYLDMITIKSADSKMIDSEIGYLNISIFANNTYDQANKALNFLIESGMKSLIVDVRNNSGGYLTSVEKILGLFLDNTHIIYQTEDKSGILKFYSQGKSTVNYKIVVLTNESTASASEILTAALKENLNAISVGKNTYGKGSAQKLHTLDDGSKYKFTTQKWLTPSGMSIDGVGIGVDYDITMDNIYYNVPTNENDNQLQYAIELLK